MSISRAQVAFQHAQAAHQQGRLADARRLYQQVLLDVPKHPDANHLLGLVYATEGEYAKGESHLRKAVSLAPKNPIFHNNLGECLRRSGKPQAAAACYETAVQLAPDFAPAHFNLGNVVKLAGRIDVAEACYQRAVQLQPGYADAHYNLGNLYLETGRYRSAIDAFDAALRAKPDYAGAHNNRGAALKEWDRFDEAIAAYGRALEIQPDFTEAHRNIAQCYEAISDLDSARRHFMVAARQGGNPLERLHAAAMAPLIPPSLEAIAEYRANLLEVLDVFIDEPFTLDWNALKEITGEPPSVIVYQGEDDRPIKEKYARIFGDKLPQDAPSPRSGRPHVGFVVTHGHEGVFLKCLRGLVAKLPAERFDVTVVCSLPNGEAILRPKIESHTVRYLPLPRRPADAAAALREARFDLLYWWEVGTDSANYFLPYLKLAPIQCTSWGWPITSGIPAMDWFVSCEGLEPADGEAHYSERLVRLARLSTYYFRPPVPLVPKPPTEFGFAAGERVYFCQQNLRKVQPDFDDLVGGILRTDPKGVVAFVSDKQPRLSALLMERLRKRLPDVFERVRMLPRLEETDYLSLCVASDVILDTTRYGGGANTIYDAFAAGTPVVTLPTRFHRGRYACAAYRQIGLEGAVASDPADFVAKAVGFATEPDRRAAFVKALAERSPALLEDQGAVDELADWFGTVIGR